VTVVFPSCVARGSGVCIWQKEGKKVWARKNRTTTANQWLKAFFMCPPKRRTGGRGEIEIWGRGIDTQKDSCEVLQNLQAQKRGGLEGRTATQKKRCFKELSGVRKFVARCKEQIPITYLVSTQRRGGGGVNGKAPEVGKEARLGRPEIE